MEVKAKRTNKKFTHEEDMKLRKLISKHGENAWEEVASEMIGRNVRQCHDRWTYYLSPKVSTVPWTEEEDEKLIQLTKELNGKWVQIAKRFKGRNDIQIKNRWNTLRKTMDLPDIHKKKKAKENKQTTKVTHSISNPIENKTSSLVNKLLDNLVLNLQSEESSYDIFNFDNSFW